MTRNRARRSGFTLVEVLVALAILAIALAAAMRTLHLATDGARDSRLRLAATWAAQNQLAELTARRAFPDASTDEGFVEVAGVALKWQNTYSSTPNPLFRKVDIRVSTAADPSYALAQLAGYLVKTTQ